MQDFNGLSSAAKAFSIVEYVGTTGRRSLADLSAFTGLPKSSLLRMLASLIDLGFLQRTAHGEYGVTLKLWRIGCAAVDYNNVRDNIYPTLQQLVQQTGETALYAVYDDGSATYVEKVDGLHPIRSYASVGSRSPAYASATGKALLCWQDEAEIARVGAGAQALTDSTHVGREDLLRHARETRAAGYAVNRGEWRKGVWGVAAPVFGRGTVPVAAIGVSGPQERIEPQIEPFSVVVCKAAQALSAHHGSLSPAA